MSALPEGPTPKRIPPQAAQTSRSLLIAIVIDTVIAAVLFGLSIYHFTHQGPRSGVLELLATILLLAGAYLVSKGGAAVMNLGAAAIMVVLSLYHLTTGGWRSGVTQAAFTVLLLMAARIFYRAR